MNTFLKTTILAFTVISFYKCATVTSPDGGPKDEIAPKLVTSNPRNNQVNFNQNTIELTFTELIKLQNPKEQIIIIPPTGKRTQFIAKKNRLEIIPEQPLAPNTTYAIKFRNAVQDITEGNPVPNLNLAFSTGPYIDSLSISGKVTEALTENIPEATTVAVFSSDTFNIFKHQPSYFTETDKSGTFTLTNLKPGTYRIYSFKDTNKNLIVESKSEKYAFNSTPIHLTANLQNISLKLVNLDSRPLQITSVRHQADINTIRLNKLISTYSLSSTQHINHIFGTDQAEILIYHPTNVIDSLAVHFKALDSLDQKIDTVIYTKRVSGDRIAQTFTVSTTSPELIQEKGTITFQIKYNKPIHNLNQDSIIIRHDSISQSIRNNSTITNDTLAKQLNVTYRHKATTEKPTKLTLHLGKGYLTSIDNDSAKTENKSITIKTIETTGTLTVQIQTKATYYITQVLNSSNQLLAQTTNQPNSTFNYLNPENVKVRLIIDINQNGRWDTANYLTNTEPEPVIFYINSDKSYTTPIRANWDVGPLIIKF